MNDKDLMLHIRTQLGLSQTEMADKLGYGSQQAISLIEQGDRQLSGVARRFLEYIQEKELESEPKTNSHE